MLRNPLSNVLFQIILRYQRRGAQQFVCEGLSGGALGPKPSLDGNSVVNVGVDCHNGIGHQVSRYWAAAQDSQHTARYHSTLSTQHSTLSIQHSTPSTQHSTPCSTQHTMFNTAHSTYGKVVELRTCIRLVSRHPQRARAANLRLAELVCDPRLPPTFKAQHQVSRHQGGV